jgi:hypothetical protein
LHVFLDLLDFNFFHVNCLRVFFFLCQKLLSSDNLSSFDLKVIYFFVSVCFVLIFSNPVLINYIFYVLFVTFVYL